MPDQSNSFLQVEKDQVSPADVKRLATLLHLQKRARSSNDISELNFILVNESFNLVKYRQAALWCRDGGIQALSGMAMPEGNAPYVQWLNAIMKVLEQDKLLTFKVLEPQSLPDNLQNQWSEWLPANVLIIALNANASFTGGYLLLARDRVWNPAEITLLSEWGQAWIHARTLLEPQGWLRSVRRWFRLERNSNVGKGEKPTAGMSVLSLVRQPRLWLLASLITVMLMPVRLTVLAPAELVPKDPRVITAPLDGVVEQILVQPNQMVDQGEPLLVFERSAIANRLLVAQGVINTLRTEYRQRAQQALIDPSSAVELAHIEGQTREKLLELDYLEDLLARGKVLSPSQGIVFLDDPLQWSGRPVVTGQRIMVVAEENSVLLEAWLALGDAITLEPSSRVRLFLNADPLTPIEAILEYVSFQAQERPDGQFAYRVQARLLDENAPNVRVGLKGTAKLEGERVTVIYWVLRRPVAALRGWLGV